MLKENTLFSREAVVLITLFAEILLISGNHIKGSSQWIKRQIGICGTFKKIDFAVVSDKLNIRLNELPAMHNRVWLYIRNIIKLFLRIIEAGQLRFLKIRQAAGK